MENKYSEDRGNSDNALECEPDTEQDALQDIVAEDKRRAEHAVQYKTLESAWDAAENGDPVGMLEAIYASKFLDGLFNVLRSMDRFNQLPDSELEMAVAEGVENFYAKVVSGAKILNLPAYLWKTCQHSALARFRKKQSCEVPTEPEKINAMTPLHDAAPSPVPDEGESEETEDIDPEQRRQAMLHFARKILPRLGQENIQKVMACVFDAVEQGILHLPPSAIAETTGLKPNTVSVLLNRGFERMSREAVKEGLWDEAHAKQFIESFKAD